VACDASSQMLMIGRNRTSFGGQARIDWTDCPAEALRAADASFDVITCQQGAQFFSDRPKAFAEMKRVLKPTGRIALSVWAPIERCKVFNALYQALKQSVP